MEVREGNIVITQNGYELLIMHHGLFPAQRSFEARASGCLVGGWKAVAETKLLDQGWHLHLTLGWPESGLYPLP